ncbi:uncharacterized protein [Drosophila bipectinata]|uniref:uncharacterized protein n=1 Tax=Drosophila bipectinata TaxID=42026 RepID=UPI001C8A980D|nr:uncharacterized protein LOC122322015 [Drosophila bipectinata]
MQTQTNTAPHCCQQTQGTHSIHGSARQQAPIAAQLLGKKKESPRRHIIAGSRRRWMAAGIGAGPCDRRGTAGAIVAYPGMVSVAAAGLLYCPTSRPARARSRHRWIRISTGVTGLDEELLFCWKPRGVVLWPNKWMQVGHPSGTQDARRNEGVF